MAHFTKTRKTTSLVFIFYFDSRVPPSHPLVNGWANLGPIIRICDSFGISKTKRRMVRRFLIENVRCKKENKQYDGLDCRCFNKRSPVIIEPGSRDEATGLRITWVFYKQPCFSTSTELKNVVYRVTVAPSCLLSIGCKTLLSSSQTVYTYES